MRCWRCGTSCRYRYRRRKRSAGRAARSTRKQISDRDRGFTETVGAGKLYNAAAVFQGGRVVGIYRKHHPEIRRSVYSAGNQSSVFTAGPLSFGIMICDSNYPELATDMVARGASAISRISRAVDIARARDNEVMIVRADVAGRTANRVSFGSSAIVDARGTVLRVGEALREDVLVVEVNTEGTKVRTDACGPNVRFVSSVTAAGSQRPPSTSDAPHIPDPSVAAVRMIAVCT